MPITFRLESQIEKRLNALVKETGRTRSFYLRELVENGMDELERIYLAASATERVRKSKQAIPRPEADSTLHHR